MKKIISLALVLVATTLMVHAQSNTQKEVKPATTTAAASATIITSNPLFQPSGNAGTNPLFEGSVKADGQPIGGIVVKGGQNGLEKSSGNPIPSIGVVVKQNITGEERTTGNPIGGIIVKSDKSISAKGIK